MKQIKYLLELKTYASWTDASWSDEQIEVLGYELYTNDLGYRYVIYKPNDKKKIHPEEIPFWKDVESIEAFDELEQIEGQLEFDEEK